MVKVKTYKKKIKASKIKEPKAKEGDIVLFGGEEVVVKSISYDAHPEFFIGGSPKTKSGYYYWLEPIDSNSEEIDGWVNERRIRLLPKKQTKLKKGDDVKAKKAHSGIYIRSIDIKKGDIGHITKVTKKKISVQWEEGKLEYTKTGFNFLVKLV